MNTHHIQEECGVFGCIGHPEAANITYLGLFALQHRGQESAGIVAQNGSHFTHYRGIGLVSEVFNDKNLQPLIGNRALGHVRYSTTGTVNHNNVQPLLINCSKGNLALAHNGNIVNAGTLRRELSNKGHIFQTTLDSEVILHMVSRSRHQNSIDALSETLQQIRGAYSIALLSDDLCIAARDPWGVRPLVIGKLDNTLLIASESCAFDMIGATLIREVLPGEMVILSDSGITSHMFAEPHPHAHCIFEYIYFSRPDSIVFGKSVYEVRTELGRQLARETAVDADLVIGVPDSGNYSAIGYAEESGIPYDLGLIRNHYIGRTFIQNSTLAREFGVKVKLSPIHSLINGKRIIVIDDSIVRGTTSKKIVAMLRNAGAREIHLRSSAPAYRHPCYYGVDTPNPKALIAANNTIKEIESYLQVDSLQYLSIEGMLKAVDKTTPEQTPYCTACFSGNYPIVIEEGISKEHLEV